MADRDVRVFIEVATRDAEGNVRSLANESAKLGNTIRTTADVSSRGFRRIGSVASVALGNIAANAVASVSAGLRQWATDSVRTGMTFETTMSRVEALSQSTEAQLQMQTTTARELGATTAFSATEAAKGYAELAAAGYIVEEQISALPGILDAAAAGQTSIGEAASIVSNVLNGFSLEAAQSGRVADVLAATANKSSTELAGLGETMKVAAPVAGGLELELEGVAAAVGIMGDVGIQGSEAGAGLRASLIMLINPSREAADMMERLGINVIDAKGDMLEVPQLVGEIARGMEGMTSAQQQATLATLVGQEAISGFASLVAAGEENLQSFTEELKNSRGAAERTAKTLLDNLAGDTEEFGGALEEVQIALFNVFGDNMREAVQGSTDLVRDLTDGVITVAEFFDRWADVILNTAKAAGVLAVGVGTYRTAQLLANKVTLVSILRLQVAARAARMYGTAQIAASLATRGATAAMRAFKVAFASNPIGFLATVVTTAATAWLLFADHTASATEAAEYNTDAVEDEIEALQEMEETLDRMSGRQLLDQQTGLLKGIDDGIAKVEAAREEVQRLEAAVETTRADIGVPVIAYEVEGEESLLAAAEYEDRLAAAHENLAAQSRLVGEQMQSLGELRAYTTDNLKGSIDVLREKVETLAAEGVETEELIRTKELLAEKEEKYRKLISTPPPRANPEEGPPPPDVEALDIDRIIPDIAEVPFENVLDNIITKLESAHVSDTLLDGVMRDLRAIDDLAARGIIDPEKASQRQVAAIEESLAAMAAMGVDPANLAMRELEARLEGAKEEAWQISKGEPFRQLAAGAAEAARTVSQVLGAMHQRRIEEINAETRAETEQIDRRIENARSSKEEEIAAIEEQMAAAERGTARYEALQEKKRAIEEETHTRIAALETSRRQEKREAQEAIAEQRREQAKVEKVAALFQIAVNTAVAVSKVLAQTGVLSPFAIPAVIAGGVAQAAIVAAQPIPSYAEGAVGLKSIDPGGRPMRISGPGGPTDDRIFALGPNHDLIRVSDGESIVTAAATAAAPTALSAMNESPAVAAQVERIVRSAPMIPRFRHGAVGLSRPASTPKITTERFDDQKLLGALRKSSEKLQGLLDAVSNQTERLERVERQVNVSDVARATGKYQDVQTRIGN